MADIIKQVFSVAESKRQAKIYQGAAKAMADHCDERIAKAAKALRKIRALANGAGNQRTIIDKIFGIATEAARELEGPRGIASPSQGRGGAAA